MQHKALRRLGRAGKAGVHGLALLLGLIAGEHPVRQVPEGRTRAYADADARKAVAAGFEQDIAPAIVRARAAEGANAQRAQLQVDVIRKDHHILRLHLVPLHGRSHAVAGKVHVGLRLDQRHALAAHRALADQPMAARARDGDVPAIR